MPEAPEPQRPRSRVLVFTVLGAVLCAALIVALVGRIGTRTTSGSGGDKEGQPATFDVGPASQRAASIARSGPILFPDPQGGTRDIFVQHLGEANWVAFEARAAGAPRQCALRWEQSARHFVDPCDGRIFPADGAGLVTFPAAVNDRGRVIVDLTRPVQP
jgi:hypothetical protein